MTFCDGCMIATFKAVYINEQYFCEDCSINEINDLINTIENIFDIKITKNNLKKINTKTP